MLGDLRSLIEHAMLIFMFCGGFIAKLCILLNSCSTIANLSTSQLYGIKESLATFASVSGIK